MDPRDEPSAEWGWHGSFPNGTRIAGVVSGIILLVLLIGPYQTHLQDFWMIPLALGLIGEEHLAHLEQAEIGEAAIGVAARGGEQARQQ